VPPRGKPADAIRYALTRWHGLTPFLHDGRVELDTNPVERAIRPVTPGRKNHLFAGSDIGGERWATLSSIIETCLCRSRHKHVYAAQRTMPSEHVFPMIHTDRHVIGSA
jgi:transposase